jgi:hypothetical protein
LINNIYKKLIVEEACQDKMFKRYPKAVRKRIAYIKN